MTYKNNTNIVKDSQGDDFLKSIIKNKIKYNNIFVSDIIFKSNQYKIISSTNEIKI